MRFRSKLAFLEAEQFLKDKPVPPGVQFTNGGPFVNTPSGRVSVVYGDWIAAEASGHYYPIKPGIFPLRWEPDQPEGKEPDGHSNPEAHPNNANAPSQP